jgi:hypothetical protein
MLAQSIEELTAKVIEPKARMLGKSTLRIGCRGIDIALKQAKLYEIEDEVERAYVFYMVACVAVIEVFPKHAEYRRPENAPMVARARQQLKEALQKTEQLHPKVKAKYEEEEAKRRAEAEAAQQEPPPPQPQLPPQQPQPWNPAPSAPPIPQAPFSSPPPPPPSMQSYQYGTPQPLPPPSYPGGTWPPTLTPAPAPMQSHQYSTQSQPPPPPFVPLGSAPPLPINTA